MLAKTTNHSSHKKYWYCFFYFKTNWFNININSIWFDIDSITILSTNCCQLCLNFASNKEQTWYSSLSESLQFTIAILGIKLSLGVMFGIINFNKVAL